MGKNDVNQIADNVRVVHAGCGVNALSGLQMLSTRSVSPLAPSGRGLG